MQFVSHWKMNVGDKMQIFFTSSSFFMSFFIGFAMMPLLFSCAHIVLFLCDMVVTSFSLRPPYGENELSNQGRRGNLHVCGQLMFTSHGSVLRSATCSYIVSSLLGIHLVKSWIMPRFCFLYQNFEIFAPWKTTSLVAVGITGTKVNQKTPKTDFQFGPHLVYPIWETLFGTNPFLLAYQLSCSFPIKWNDNLRLEMSDGTTSWVFSSAYNVCNWIKLSLGSRSLVNRESIWS